MTEAAASVFVRYELKLSRSGEKQSFKILEMEAVGDVDELRRPSPPGDGFIIESGDSRRAPKTKFSEMT